MLLMDLIHSPRKKPAGVIVDFLRFTCQELGLKTIPKVRLLSKPVSTKIANSFAAYSPPRKDIVLYVKGRHILDLLRSLAHEMVHYRQDLNNDLNVMSGQTGSDHENEANAIAGQIMRKYGKLHPELF
jgi:hypothetical protein